MSDSSIHVAETYEEWKWLNGLQDIKSTPVEALEQEESMSVQILEGILQDFKGEDHQGTRKVFPAEKVQEIPQVFPVQKMEEIEIVFSNTEVEETRKGAKGIPAQKSSENENRVEPPNILNEKVIHQLDTTTSDGINLKWKLIELRGSGTAPAEKSSALLYWMPTLANYSLAPPTMSKKPGVEQPMSCRNEGVTSSTNLQQQSVVVPGTSDMQVMQRSNDKLKTKKTTTCHISFMCIYCKKRFQQNASMTRHVKIHEGAEVHRCPICSTPYKHKSTLLKHVKLVHK